MKSTAACHQITFTNWKYNGNSQSNTPVIKHRVVLYSKSFFFFQFRRGDYVLPLLRRHGIIVELDENGHILRSFQSPDGKTSDLSQVTEYKGYLYLGSFINDYLGRLKL